MHSSERIQNTLIAPCPDHVYVDYLDYKCPECGHVEEAEKDIEYHACSLCGEYVYHENENVN